MAVIKIEPKDNKEKLKVNKQLCQIMRSLKPLIVLTKLTGVFFFNFNKSTLKLDTLDKKKTCFYSSVYFISYLLLSWITLKIKCNVDDIWDLFGWATNIFNSLFYVSLLGQVLMGFLYKYSIVRWWNSLAENDVLMEKIGLKVDYKYLQKILRTMFFIKFTLSVIRGTLLVLGFDYLSWLDLLTLSFCYVVITSVKVFFVALILHIYLRFLEINKALQNLPEKRMDVATIAVSGSSDLEETSFKLAKLCRVHFKLCHLSKRLNSIAAIKLFYIFTASLISMLYFSYFLYHNLRNVIISKGHFTSKSALMAMIGAVALVDEIGECFMMTRSCMLLSTTANGTPKCLHEFRNKIYNLHLEEAIQNYSLQFLHQKLTFTAIGFFNIDFKLIYSMFGTVITYLVLFIQNDQTLSNLTLSTEPEDTFNTNMSSNFEKLNTT